MEKRFDKILPFVLIVSLLVLFNMDSAFGFKFPSIPGVTRSKKNASVSIDSLADNQSRLYKRLYAALIQVNKAQLHFAKVMDDKKAIGKLELVNKLMGEGNVEDKNSIDKVVAITKDVAKAQSKQTKKVSDLDENKKRELQKGLMPYALGTAHTVQLGPEFADHLISTKDAVKGTSVTKILSVKNQLGATLKVAPKVPSLSKSLLSTTHMLIKVAKKEKLNTSNAEKALGDLS